MSTFRTTTLAAALALIGGALLSGCGDAERADTQPPPEQVGASGASVATSENTTASNPAEPSAAAPTETPGAGEAAPPPR